MHIHGKDYCYSMGNSDTLDINNGQGMQRKTGQHKTKQDKAASKTERRSPHFLNIAYFGRESKSAFGITTIFITTYAFILIINAWGLIRVMRIRL